MAVGKRGCRGDIIGHKLERENSKKMEGFLIGIIDLPYPVSCLFALFTHELGLEGSGFLGNRLASLT